MDTHEAAFEAEVELDGQALSRQQQRQKTQRGEEASRIAKGGVTINTRDGHEHHEREGDERSPLLQRDSQDHRDGDDDRRDSFVSVDAEYAGLPWYRTPSIFWIVVPFFILACAFGGAIAPKMNLILELVCREYMSERAVIEPGFTVIPVDFQNGDNDQCRIPEVQSRVAALTTWGNLISGLLSAFISPKLGALSDRYGRKTFLIISSMGTILSEVVTIFAASYPETFPVSLMLLGYALDGLTGSFILAMSISNAYATDCTPPRLRSVAFGYLHACLFTGVAIGPIAAGLLVKYTGHIVNVFIVAIAVHITFVLFVGLIVPESLSKKRREEAKKKHLAEQVQVGPEWDLVNSIRALNLLEPLKILMPTGPGTSSALRKNLVVLAAVDTIVFGVAMGMMQVLIIYVNYQFGWKSYESGVFMTIVSSSRVLGLIVLLPLATRIFRRNVDTRPKGCDLFDLSVIRIAVLLDILGFVGYTLARTGPIFTLAGTAAALGGIGSPTLQSALTKHVPAERTGQLLGAVGLLHALARVVSPTVFGFIYSITVGKFTQTVFVCLSATFGLAFLISWFLKPHVYYDEDAAMASNPEDTDGGAHRVNGDSASAGGSRIPIVSSVAAALGQKSPS